METKGFKSQFKHQIYTNLIQSCKGLCAGVMLLLWLVAFATKLTIQNMLDDQCFI